MSVLNLVRFLVVVGVIAAVSMVYLPLKARAQDHHPLHGHSNRT